MKKLILMAALAALTGLVAGCESLPRPFHEFYYVDREWGDAQMKTWDKQIINKEPSKAAAPEGMDGLDAERIMGVVHETYNRMPTRSETMDMDLTSD